MGRNATKFSMEGTVEVLEFTGLSGREEEGVFYMLYFSGRSPRAFQTLGYVCAKSDFFP